MLIRSQDRTAIVNLANIDTICLNEDERSIVAYNGSADSIIQLGTYSTKEKAIKALNKLEDGIFENRVFQMPQDSEV